MYKLLFFMFGLFSLTGCLPFESNEDKNECGASSATMFDITVTQIVILPTKPGGQEPWDWDGTVPSWLLELVQIVNEAYAALMEAEIIPETGKTIAIELALDVASEVLDLIDENAPELLEGTIPPDPWVELFLEDASADRLSLGYSETLNDSYAGDVNTSWPGIKIPDGYDLIIEVQDEDIAIHDWAGAFRLNQEDLKSWVNCGPVALSGSPDYGLQLAVIEVQPNQ